MQMRLNPIVKKDLQVTARSMRISWGLFAYEGVLLLAFLLALTALQASSGSIYSDGNVYSGMIALFPILAVVQVCIVALITPIITASSISGEKERQTFDIMLTTCMSPFSIVLGKVMSAVVRILFFVVGSLPIMSLSFVVGGLDWSTLFYFVLAIILLSVFSGSIGIFCSSVCRRSISAVIVSFVIYFGVYVLTFLPLLVRALLETDTAGESLLFLLFNPMIFFVEFFLNILTGRSLFSSYFNIGRNDVGIITYTLAQEKVWMFASAACILILSLLFMLAAAWKVNPMHSSGSRRKVKKSKAADMR